MRPTTGCDVYSELPNTGLELRWDSSPNQNDHDLARNANVTTDGAGHASLDFSSMGGLALGVNGNLYYYDADGQCIEPWWRAMVELVDPAEILNTASHEISIMGVGFEATPTVYLGQDGAKQVQLTNVSLVGASGTLLKATVPAGTRAGVYELHVYNPDERVGFLADAVTIRGSRDSVAADPEALVVKQLGATCRVCTTASGIALIMSPSRSRFALSRNVWYG